jgi:ABC-type multidrug transport system ATPase subunit
MSVPAMRAVGLSKRFGTFEALRDLNLEVARGEVLGYLGPNGAGKTTTIRLFLGLINPSADGPRSSASMPGRRRCARTVIWPTCPERCRCGRR